MPAGSDAHPGETQFELDARVRPASSVDPLSASVVAPPSPGGAVPAMVSPDAPVLQSRYETAPVATESRADAPAAPSAFGQALESLQSTAAGLSALQSEIDNLKNEITLLRSRDETLKFYMLRLDEELRLAARLQQDFLPKQLPQIGPVHFHVLFRPCGYVSGDLYDVARLDEKRVGFCIVDAVGHGMPAALLTMFIKRALVCKEITPSGYRLLPPAETMGRVNDALVEQNLSAATFATAIYGLLDTESLTLTLAGGGHPSPLLLRGDALTELTTEGPLLGIFPGEVFGQTSFQLQSGDRLIVFSDGLEVALGDDVATQSVLWRQELLARRSLPAEGMVIDFSSLLDSQSGSIAPKDDLTLLVIEIK
jgi:sigma-B regulation protein RsbU (phosphoserine phosphatase)